MGINFEKISDKIHKHFDTDLMDIYRKIDESADRVEIYSNIPCNIEINQEDNPNPTAIDVTPIVSSLIIHMPNWVDVRNNDYIVAKRMSNSNQILTAYRGVCGEPAVWQSRKTINMQMSAIEEDKPITPPPPVEQSIAKVYFRDISDDREIRSSVEQILEQGKTSNIYPVTIENYSLEQSFLDGQQVETDVVTIEDPQARGHEVVFKYSQQFVISSFRLLVKGAYTTDNGSLASGYHLYAKTPVLLIAGIDGNYSIQVESNKVEHEDLGSIRLNIGSVIKTNTEEWLKISSTPTKLSDGTYFFETEPYEPTEEESKAYETHWYG